MQQPFVPQTGRVSLDQATSAQGDYIVYIKVTLTIDREFVGSSYIYSLMLQFLLLLLLTLLPSIDLTCFSAADRGTEQRVSIALCAHSLLL